MKRDWNVIRTNLKKLVVLCYFKGIEYEKNGEQKKAFACYYNMDKFQGILDQERAIRVKHGLV